MMLWFFFRSVPINPSLLWHWNVFFLFSDLAAFEAIKSENNQKIKKGFSMSEKARIMSHWDGSNEGSQLILKENEHNYPKVITNKSPYLLFW